MSNEQPIPTLEGMTKKSIEESPKDSLDAVDAYFDLHFGEAHPTLSPDQLEALKTKIKARFEKNSRYFDQFRNAVIQSSSMIFLAIIKSTRDDVEIDFSQYTREFLFFARPDDRDIYDMRIYYLNSLTAKVLQIGLNVANNTPENIAKQQEEYDLLIGSLKKQYLNSKIHLLA